MSNENRQEGKGGEEMKRSEQEESKRRARGEEKGEGGDSKTKERGREDSVLPGLGAYQWFKFC